MPDPRYPIDETLSALDALVRAGKVREIGSSNFSGEQIDADRGGVGPRRRARFVSAQNDFNMLHREPLDDVVPACVRHGLAPALLPAGERSAHRQVPAGASRHRPAPGSRRCPTTGRQGSCPTATSSGSTACQPLPRRVTTPSSTWRSPGWRGSRRWRRSSPAPRNPTRCAPTWPRASGRCRTRRARAARPVAGLY